MEKHASNGSNSVTTVLNRFATAGLMPKDETQALEFLKKFPEVSLSFGSALLAPNISECFAIDGGK
jgi:hypothetical protein